MLLKVLSHRFDVQSYTYLVALSRTGHANVKAMSICMLIHNSSSLTFPSYTCVCLCALVQQPDSNSILIWWILLNCCFILIIWSSFLLRVQDHTASVPLLNIIIPDAWRHVTVAHVLISDSKPNYNKRGTWFGQWPLNAEHYCLPQRYPYILLTLSVSRFTKPTTQEALQIWSLSASSPSQIPPSQKERVLDYQRPRTQMLSNLRLNKTALWPRPPVNGRNGEETLSEHQGWHYHQQPFTCTLHGRGQAYVL